MQGDIRTAALRSQAASPSTQARAAYRTWVQPNLPLQVWPSWGAHLANDYKGHKRLFQVVENLSPVSKSLQKCSTRGVTPAHTHEV